MLSTRRLLLVALAAPLTLVACGGGGDDDEIVVPEGTHRGYVVSKVSVVPTAPNVPTDPGYGLDLGSKTSAMLDGRIDNNLGYALTILSGLSMDLDVQGTLTTAVTHGNVILLVDFQTKDFASSNAGFGLKFGSDPMPAACTSSADTTCGHHLAGGATFKVATNSPNNALLGGRLANGAMDGGPGEISLQITIGNTTPILLPLVHARVKVTAASDTGLKALIGGLITAADLKANVGESLAMSIKALLVAGCTQLEPPSLPDCGCTGLAKTVLNLLDGDTQTALDCKISAEEVLANPATATYTTPDGCSKDTCTTPDALSVGLNIEAVPATFPL
jgi:hypothetical protein